MKILDLLSSINRKDFLILKIQKINRDYDVFTTSEYEKKFLKKLLDEKIQHIRIDYKYVIRYYIFDSYNFPIDFIIKPIIRYREYSFNNINLKKLNSNIASKTQNNAWKKFQLNRKHGTSFRSKVSLSSIIYYLRVAFRAQFLILGFTLSGPDGSGKSTSLKLLESALNQMRIKYLKKRQVYGVLPRPAKIIRKKYNTEIENSSPDSSKPKSFILSFITSIYYILDYFLGYICVLFRKNKYSLIIFDRYIFDFTVHIKRNALHRYMIPLFKFFTKFFSKGFTHVLCYAPPEIIHQRKNELDLNTISDLNKKYLNIKNINSIWYCYEKI